MFRVGDKVVCVVVADDSRRRDRGQAKTPVKGKIYTIREIILNEYDTICFRLKEILNPKLQYEWPSYPVEKAFIEQGFEKVVETDISVFREIATNPQREVLEDA